MFDKWSHLSVCPEPPIKPRYVSPPRKCFADKKYSTLRTDELLVEKADIAFFKSCSLPTRPDSRSFEKYLDAWSSSLLAEFNTIIQNENQCQSADAAVDSADDDYDEVAGDSSDDDSMRMKYRVSQRDDFEVSSSSSPTVSPSTSEHSSSGSSSANGNARRTPPYLSRIGRSKQRSHVASVHNKRDPTLVNVKIYPTEQPRIPEMRRPDYEFENGHHVSDKHVY